MQRVMIVGGPGSGKTTLAKAMAARVTLPVWHVDQIIWEPNWVERDDAERMRQLYQIQMYERWIIEGNYPPTYRERVARADTLIFLDFPAWQRISRVTWRVARNFGRPRAEMPEGCIERFDRNYLDFLDFIWTTRESTRAQILRYVEEPPAHLTVHHLRSQGDVRRFLRGLGRGVDQPAIGAVRSA